jgi:hypothetical protein
MENNLDLNDVLGDAEAFRALPKDEQLKQLAYLCGMQVGYEEAIIDLEAKLGQARDHLKTISERDIPAIMTELGLMSIKLTNGKEVTLKPFVSVKSTPEVVEWLAQNGHEDIIKGTIKAVFPKGFDKDALASIAAFMAEEGLAAETETTVHYQTLAAWAKQAVQTGIAFPRELFNFYQGFKTNIK